MKERAVVALIRNEIIKTRVFDNSNSFHQRDLIKANIKSAIKRDYKLTNNNKFDIFYNFLSSELRVIDLLYVIDKNEKRKII